MIEIIGKNGAGKSYLANKLYSNGFKRNVGYTTRPMREGEVDGIDYFFILEKEFKKMMKDEEFIDYKFRNGYYYGIAKDNIGNNSILVSGDANKIEKITGFEIMKLYVDCDLTIRYLRVLERNDNKSNIFQRFHTENFSYLYDFNATFINNNKNNNLFEGILTIINGSNLSNNMLASNRHFIQEKILKDEIIMSIDNSDLLMVLLKYEEYLLRKLYLENSNLYDQIVIDKYNDCMIKFMNYNNIEYSIINNEICVDIDSESYRFDYKLKRKVKK